LVADMKCFLGGVIALGVTGAIAHELPTLAGPAMGTTYRVTLGAVPAGVSRGELHREIEEVLARIDRAASTWRQDSDVSRFNGAPAAEWVAVSADLLAIVEIARGVHERSGGAFDITIAPLLGLPPGAFAEQSRAAAMARVGMRHVESRAFPPALRKRVDGLAVDLGGIGPGYAVDRIGERLVELSSPSHLVELGGEVRAWGVRPGGEAWRVRLRARSADGTAEHVLVDLGPGEAIATATSRLGRSPVDPRTGLVVGHAATSVSVRAATCAEADAGAVAALVTGAP
jgi:thiamine biosynthesis lipoprotein